MSGTESAAGAQQCAGQMEHLVFGNVRRRQMDKREECLKREQRMLQVHNRDPKLIWVGREETIPSTVFALFCSIFRAGL